MKAHIQIQTLSDICDIPLCICDHVLLLKFFVFLLWRFHIFEAIMPLNEPDKDYLLVDLRIDFHEKLNFLDVSLDTCAEKVSFSVNDHWFCSLKVSLDQAIMALSNWPWHKHTDVLTYQVLSFVSKNVLDFLVSMLNYPNL